MTIFVRLASACAWTRLQLEFCSSKDSGFTKPMIYCVITAIMTNLKVSMHLAKPAAFVRVCSVDSYIVDKIVSWIILSTRH